MINFLKQKVFWVSDNTNLMRIDIKSIEILIFKKLINTFLFF